MLDPRLRRQLARLGVDAEGPPDAEAWGAFLRRVDRTYRDQAEDLAEVEQSLEASCRELQELYVTLDQTSETRLARQRNELHALMQAITDGVLAFDRDGRPLFANHAATRLQGRPVEALEAPEALAPLRGESYDGPSLLEQAESGTALEDVDTLLLRPDGERVPVALSLTPIHADGERSGFVVTLRDQSERLRDREMLAEAIEEARKGAEAKGEFLANMSHEIRTPMNGILGVADLLMASPLDDDQRELATTLKSSGEALLTLVNDILDFSKLEAGKVELESIAFDLRRTVDEVLELDGGRAERKGLELAAVVHRDVPRKVLGDPARLRQVLLNLVSNAVKFTDSGSVVVDVQPAAEGRLRLAVRDTGIGIPEDRRHRLFASFEQVDASTTRKYGGTGLGLAICQRLVESMGGIIEVDSTVGEGSTFRFDIRLDDAEASREQPLAEDRVLVIDSSGGQAPGCVELLASLGARADVCRKPKDAARLLASRDDPYTACLFVHRNDSATRAFVKTLRARSTLADLRLVLLVPVADRGSLESLVGRGVDGLLSRPPKARALASIFGRSAPRPSLKPRPAPAALAQDVLVVEDNKVNQLVARRLLERLGCTVTVANDGVEGVEAALGKRYDAVFMDCQMPRMDGLEATRTIRRSEQEESRAPMRIIALTANAMPEDVERCHAAGMDDYLAKPVTLDALRAKLGSQADLDAA
ncbi:MAG: ATP-binding protein [Myxococcota bacterium]